MKASADHTTGTGSIAALALLLGACGGGGGSVNSVSAAPGPSAPSAAPSVTPAPTPSPTPSPVLAPARLGLVSNQPFATVQAGVRYALGDEIVPSGKPQPLPDEAVQFRYVAQSNSYEIKLPGAASGKLETVFLAGPYGGVAHFTDNVIVAADGRPVTTTHVHLQVPGSSGTTYSYTSYGFWELPMEAKSTAGSVGSQGVFAYGIPTQPGDVPLSGSGVYAAQVQGFVNSGLANGYVLHGTAQLNFDFAAGRLTGFMNPVVPESGWAGFGHDLGRYEFAETVFARGSTGFSGRFLVPGLPNADSRFAGSFNGPQAAELMARFEAPFLKDGVSGTLAGIWFGKKN